MSWSFSEETGELGFWTVRVWNKWASDVTRVPIDADVTFFRGNPTQIGELVDQDPFGPATATLDFPGVTGFDSIGVGGTVPWMRKYTNVDVYFLPCTTESWTSLHGHPESTVIDPRTNSTLVHLHEWDEDGNRILPVWEGFFQDITPGPVSTSVICKGALYQLDRYHAKPLSPLRPKAIEEMIERYFDPRRRGIWSAPLLIDWVGAGWERVYTQDDHERLDALGGMRFWPTKSDASTGSEPFGGDEWEIPLGTLWTTWLTRQTGNWEVVLTGYIHGMLGMLYAKPDDHLDEGEDPWSSLTIRNGDAWSIRMDPGRRPVMYLKRQLADPTVTLDYGSPGVEANVSASADGSYNVVLGQGVGADGVAWNELVNIDANYITYQPIYPEASEDGLYVGWEAGNNLKENYDGYNAAKERLTGNTVTERYISDFPSGIDEDDAIRIARMWAQRDSEPGWAGSIDLHVDPVLYGTTTPHSRWRLRSGDTIFLRGFQGEMEPVAGVNVFHVNETSKKPHEGAMTVQVDTKFRDRLTIEHAEASGRDSLSVAPSLRVGQMSNNIEDRAAPWSQNKGAGVIPKSSYRRWTRKEVFPYTDFTTADGNRPQDCFRDAWLGGGGGFSHSEAWSGVSPQYRVIKMLETPRSSPTPNKALSLQNTLIDDDLDRGLYIPVQAGAANRNRRWAFFPLLLSQAGTIMRTELACYDRYGELVHNAEFHMSVYTHRSTHTSMPWEEGGEYSALWDGAFERVQRNGLPWPSGASDNHVGTDAIRIGWGTYDRPGGYSPASKIFGESTPTGMLVDGSPWEFNMAGTNNEWNASEWKEDVDVGNGSPISWWVAIYARLIDEDGAEILDGTDEDNNWVYFRGRCFRQVNVGSGS